MTAMETLAHKFTCPRCNAAPGALCVDVKPVLHVERYDMARASIRAEYGRQAQDFCVRCGQHIGMGAGGAQVCDACRKAEREPQGEQVRLFAPAPTQMQGQLSFYPETPVQTM